MDLCDRWKQNSLWVKSVVFLSVLDDVRFTPKSDHLLRCHEMTLCANTDQSAAQQFDEADPHLNRCPRADHLFV